MNSRNKKLLSLLLATAMVFTMNTSVFALEVGEDAEDEYTVEFVDDGSVAEDTDGAAEVDSFEDDGFVAVDEIEGFTVDSEGAVYADNKTTTSINNLGWKITADSEATLNNTHVDEANAKVTPGGNVDLTGYIESSRSLTINGNGQADTVGIKVGTLDTDKTVTSTIDVTVVSGSNCKNSEGITSGYSHLKGFKGMDKESLNKWAATLCTDTINRVVVAVDDSDIQHKIGLRFSFSAQNTQNKNQYYGKKQEKVGDGDITYYENIPFCGKGTIKTNIGTYFGLSVSSGSTNYKIKSVSIKFDKKSNKGIITAVKLDGGSDKKKRNNIEKAIKKKKLKITMYPFNLSNNSGWSNKTVNKKKTKLTVKINGKKYTVNNGKADGYGGIAKLTASGNKITVTGSKMLTGEC